MSPFKEIIKSFSGEKIEEKEVPVGLSTLSSELGLFIDVDEQRDNRAELWVRPPELKIVVRGEEKYAGQLIPKIPIKGREGREVIIYDSSKEQEITLTWEPSIDARVAKEIDVMRTRRFFPVSTHLLDQIDALNMSRRNLAEKGKLTRGENLRLWTLMSLEGIGMLVFATVEHFTTSPALRLKDRITGRWSIEAAKLTTQYLSELEVKKQSS